MTFAFIAALAVAVPGGWRGARGPGEDKPPIEEPEDDDYVGEDDEDDEDEGEEEEPLHLHPLSAAVLRCSTQSGFLL